MGTAVTSSSYFNVLSGNTSGSSISWYDPATIRWAIGTDYQTPEVKVDKELEAKANEILKAEFAEKLLPYPASIINDEGECITACPKCGTQTFLPTFCADSEKVPEHLRWRCPCNYEWNTKTKDAQ